MHQLADFIITPNIILLSKMGVMPASFQPEESARHALLCRTSLEQCLVTSPLSYYRAEQPGMGLLRLDSGSLLYTVFQTDVSASPSSSSPAAETAPSPSHTAGSLRRAAFPAELSASLSGKCKEGVSKRLFSARERESSAVSSLRFR